MEVRLGVVANTNVPILVKVDGKEIEVSGERQNTICPMLVTPSGITTAPLQYPLLTTLPLSIEN